MLKYPGRVTGVVVQNAPTFGEPTDGPLWAAVEFNPIDSGHSALEDHSAEIGSLSRGFLDRVIGRATAL